MPINFPSNPNSNDTYTSAGTTWIYDGSVWNVVSTSTVINIPSINNFQNVAVSGQSTLVADSTADTLNFIAGDNVSITTNAENDSITINSTAIGGGGSNSFVNIVVSGEPTITADESNDTLTLVAGTGISITNNSSLDTITIANTQAAGVTNFSALNDASAASATIDQIYLPAITSLEVTNNGAIAYLFDQYVGNNPAIFAINGATIAFKLLATGHPFLIQTAAGANFNTGLIHVSTTGVVSTGGAAQGKDSGTLYWKIPSSISGNYRYQCSLHGAMVGTITIKNFASI